MKTVNKSHAGNIPGGSLSTPLRHPNLRVILPIGLFEVSGLARHQKSNDQTKKAENGAENLDDEDLDEPIGHALVELLQDTLVGRRRTGWGPQHPPKLRHFH